MKRESIKCRIEESLFNGYVLEPIPIVLFAAIVGVALFAFSLWATWDFVFPPSESQSTVEECVIIDYKRDGPIYILRSDSGFSFHLPTDSVENRSLLDVLISNHVSVAVEYMTPTKKDTITLDVLSISGENGMPIIAKDSVSAAWTKNARNSVIIMWTVCGCYFAFAAGAYYILCNAPKYPRIASVLIRAPYRRF